MGRNKLYGFVLFLSLAGSLWVVLNVRSVHIIFSGCLFHKITGLPCPACGSTRAVISFLSGNFIEAISINPLGLVTASLFTVLTIWVLRDLLTQSDSFYQMYHKGEQFIRKRKIAFTLIFLVIANWLWNITKQL